MNDVNQATTSSERKEYTNFVCLGLIHNDKGEILMVKRIKEEPGETGKVLTWSFPGGRLYEGETREDCVQREVEIGTRVKVIAEKQIALRRHPEYPVFVAYYQCRLITNIPKELKTQIPEEIGEIKWVKPEEIKSLITTPLNPDVAKFLKIG